MTHAGRAASSPEIFRPFLTVCLTVFPFEFRPRTFTIGFHGKKSFISELMILECSFPLTVENTTGHEKTGFPQARLNLRHYGPDNFVAWAASKGLFLSEFSVTLL